MKIVALQAENIKKLVAIEIRPDGNLVQITGRNGQGKTSVLDCISWALAGAAHIQAAPIRNGWKSARIRLDLGEIIVTRKFSQEKDGEATTSITVENAAGTRFPSPQKMLDALLGELSFDPLEFSRMAPRAQFDALRKFVPDVDFEEIAELNAADYEIRAGLNRQAKEMEILADQIDIKNDAELVPVDVDALVAQLAAAADHNTGIMREEDTRAARLERIRDMEIKQDALLIHHEKVLKQAAKILDESKALRNSIHAEQIAAENLLPVEAPIDVRDIQAKIDDAKAVNARVAEKAKRLKYVADAQKLREQVETLTGRMNARERAKQEKIAAASLPVPGVGFGNGAITMNDVPFDQASDAEKLRASVAIAMALNPKLRVIRVRDGSLLDEDALAMIAEMAAGNDYQVWIERVDSSGKIGFVLEDGHVREVVSDAP